jgi:hypothetical protein
MSLVRRLTAAIAAVLMATLVLSALPDTATAAAQPPDRPVPPAERTGIDPAALQAGLQKLADAGGIGIVARASAGQQSWAGALVTTTEDLDRFQSALSSGLLVSRSGLHAMRANVAVQPNGLSYGLGSYRLPDPCHKGRYVFGHDGATFGTLTMTFARPKGQMRVTVSMSGRDLDDVKTTQEIAMGAYVLDAFAQTCRDVTRRPVALPRFPG